MTRSVHGNSCAGEKCGLAAAAFVVWPRVALAAAEAERALPTFGLVAMGLFAVSGLFLALTCWDQRRAERLCVWILLQAATAILAAILVGRSAQGAWASTARMLVYAACASSVAGALVHLSALQVQWRLRRTTSLGQSLRELRRLDRRLDRAAADTSDRFQTVYAREAESIERLRRPGLAEIFRPAREDGDRANRLHTQIRYLSYGEQVAFETISGLLLRREQVLVHISPYLKRDYLLDRWCDGQACLLSVAAAFVGVYLFAVLYY